MSSNDTPTHDRIKAREALEAAYEAAQRGESAQADSLTRIADARIRMAFTHRPDEDEDRRG